MLGITFTSENFERLLFKIEPEASSSRPSTPIVLASFRPQISKKSNIVIISNGVEQSRIKHRRKLYVFSEAENLEENSEVIAISHQKKHLIKKQKKQDPDYSVKRQKNDRNVVSNIIHHLMKHCLTSVTDQSISDLIKKKAINLTVEEFREVLEQKDKLCKTYITNKHLKQLWNDLSQPDFCKAMRIISRNFFQNFSFLTILNGNKLNKQSKTIHYNGRRELVQFLNKIK